jgi:hypothetical protein
MMKKMMVAQYKGISRVSRVIKWFTRGVYSHTGLVFPDGTLLEAWEGGDNPGVRILPDLHTGHKKGTEIDLYEWVITERQYKDLLLHAHEQVGKKYNMADVLRFSPFLRIFMGSGKCHKDRESWFCSSLVIWLSQVVGNPILRGKPELVAPSDVTKSTVIKYSYSVTV